MPPKLSVLVLKRDTLQRERLALYRTLMPDSVSPEVRRLNRRIGALNLKIEAARKASV